MDLAFSPYALLLLLATFIALGVAQYLWRQRRAPGARTLALLMLAAAIWSVGYASELSSTDLPSALFWANVQYLGILSLPVLWLVFTLQYSALDHWLSRRNLLLLSLIPLAALALVWTNESHHWMRSPVTLDANGPFTVLVFKRELGFWLTASYLYVLLALGTVVLLRRLLRSAHLYRRQNVSLAIGVLVPWLSNFLYLSDNFPLQHLDPTPLAFTISGMALAWGVVRYRLLNLVPIARDAVVENMQAGVIVLDAQNRVLDMNPAASQLSGQSPRDAIGRPALEVFSAWSALVQRYAGTQVAQDEIVSGTGEAQRIYELNISPLVAPHGQPGGRLMVIRDVTERRQAEQELRRTTRELEALLHAMPDLYFRLDAHGTYLSVHAGQSADLVAAPETLLGKRIEAILPPALAQQMLEAIAQVLASNQPATVEYALPLAQGERWFEARLMPLSPREVMLVARNITASKHAEAALKDSEQRYRALFDAAQRQARELMLLSEVRSALARELDLPDVIRAVVEAISKSFGYTQVSLYLVQGEQIVLQHQIGYERSLAEFPVSQGVCGRVIRSGKPMLISDVRSEPTFIGAMEGIVSEICVPLFDQGRTVGVLNVESTQGVQLNEEDLRIISVLSEEISIALVHARLYNELRHSEERFRKIFDEGAVGMTITESDLRITRVNESMCRMLGYSATELLARTIGDVTHPADMQKDVELADKLFRGELTHYQIEKRYIRKDGDVLWVHVTASLLHDSRAGVAYRLAMVEDISLRKQSEEVLRRRAAELAALHNISLEITARQNLPTLLRNIVEQATGLLASESGSLYLCDPARREVRCVVSRGTTQDYTGRILPYGQGAAGRVATDGQPLNIHDYQLWPGRIPLEAADPAFRSVLGVPMIWQQQTRGVLIVSSHQRRFSPSDTELITLFAEQAAIAVENARLFDEVQRLATTDEGTGLANRRQLFSLGAREFSRARRFERSMGAIMLDIDHFKRVNDRHGHGFGDLVLREVAQLCQQNVRDIDIVGRYGGEEFAVLLPETSVEIAQGIAERLRQSVEALCLSTGGQEVRVTISLGVATTNPRTQEVADLLECADRALYTAKQTGRNRVSVYA